MKKIVTFLIDLMKKIVLIIDTHYILGTLQLHSQVLSSTLRLRINGHAEMETSTELQRSNEP